ncbi:hypothetical protein DF107_31670 [Burkholderia stagnalis]|nr:hypothetical protein DF161_31255 [Burkholderia stagnalis]RQQ94148.1 hypothetical protein DF031_30045 [Burkholderia stagnalis]RQX85883.1 hypothetical protein DF120_32035 [Burkholderia stagnalis]RQY75930.1 hypothetical protein DF107_31670 [Burkholderia stagnalis]
MRRRLSLKHHLALAVLRDGRGDVEALATLVNVLYLAYFLRAAGDAEHAPYRRAETALDQCAARAERGEPWSLTHDEHTALEQLVVIHDAQLAALPLHRYLAAWEHAARVSAPRALADSGRDDPRQSFDFDRPMSLREFFFRRAMKIVAKTPAPDRIPLTAPRIYGRKFFTATISDLAAGNVLVREARHGVLVADAWNDTAERYQLPVHVAYSEACQGHVELIYYLRQNEFPSDHPTCFVLGVWFGGYRLRAWWRDFRHGRYNRRTIDRRKRMDVLRTLLDHSISERKTPLTAFGVLRDALTQDFCYQAAPVASCNLLPVRMLAGTTYDEAAQHDNTTGID